MDFSSAPEPPWKRYPGKEPWWGGFRQGDSEAWYVNVFLSFWMALQATDRAQYLARWPAPSAEWSECLQQHATKPTADEPFAESPVPPWIRFPQHGPRSPFWRFGERKRWWQGTFRPFWAQLSAAERSAYLELWNPPSAAWRERVEQA